MDVLKVSGLTKLYKGSPALDNVSFSVPEGAVFGLIGPNGAGKTTAIKIITGLIRNFTGTVETFGNARGRNGRGSFAFLPELFAPHKFLSGWEYISLMAGLSGYTPDKNRIEVICGELGLEKSALANRIGTYSKGMTQKLGMAELLCSSANVLIMDEPASGLDPVSQQQFRSAVLKANKEGKSVLISSHMLGDIDTLCTHTGILSKGRLVFAGTPAELKAKHSVEDLEEAFISEVASV